MNTHLKYVLITSARNEEAYIEKTIKSVISQTILPKKWVMVSDGSTDRTEEIIQTKIGKMPLNNSLRNSLVDITPPLGFNFLWFSNGLSSLNYSK